jgi:hypothetical protein
MRKFFRVTALTALAVGAMAMTAEAQKTIGLVAGVGLSSMSGDFSSDGNSSRTGFTGGIVVGIPVGGGNMQIEPGLLYSSKGEKYDNTDFTGTFALDYIEVPILFKWSSKPAGAGVYLMGGPAINFNITCNDSGTDNFDDSTYDEDCSDSDAVDVPTVISGVVGIGYSTGRFGIEGRYDFDLGDAISVDFDTGTGASSFGAKNNVIQILARLTK